jgi:hypothetical protein
MRHCNGRLFDGSACNNPTLDCPTCATSGCLGDGCDAQLATSATCDECGSLLIGVAIAA